jgi:RNA polymerase sigma-70 factor (ECF subfamily)
MQDDASHTLLERAREGDRQALEDLIARHQAQVYRFGLKMCRNPEDAEDVLQDTLLAMARSVRDFRGASSISTWLYTIARNHCIRKRRKSKFAPATTYSLETDAGVEAVSLRDPSKAPDDVVADRQVSRALEEAIRSLEPKYREVLLLRDEEGLTGPEVAEVLGLSPQAVKSRLHRARLAVREKVAPLLGVPGGADLAPPTAACPDVPRLFSQYLEGEIAPEVCRQMERHLETCARCRLTCDSLKRTLALCRTDASAVTVPPAVQASVKVALRDFLAKQA